MSREVSLNGNMYDFSVDYNSIDKSGITLFGSKKYDAIYDRIRYLISLKSGITHTFSHYFAKIKVDSCDSLPIEKV